MKKALFLLTLFAVAGIIIYFMMKGVRSVEDDNDTKDIKDQRLVSMVDSIESADWKNNAQYRRVQTEIGMSESNGKIDMNDKNLLLSTLDTKYANSLTKKYNQIKSNFTSFPSILYNEMIAFQSKNPDLKTGIRELGASIQLQNLEGSVNQIPEIRYSSTTISNLKSKINNLPLGALNSNSICKGIKIRYLNKLSAFENDIRDLDPLIDIAERPNSDYNEFKSLRYNKSILDKYTFYRNWLRNNEYRFNPSRNKN